MSKASYDRNVPEFDYVLVGGGLQNALISMALLTRRPSVRVALVEQGPRLGGNHTWCFHADDVPASARNFVQPLVAHEWSGYQVQFPGMIRILDIPYAAVSSERLHEVTARALAGAIGCVIMTGATATRIERTAVTLGSGETLRARAVVDARGPEPDACRGHTGYQKFLGQELALAVPHALSRPVLMDATVPQDHGFRFFYVLPLAPDRVLVEETFFSDTADLDPNRLRASIAAYADSRRLRVREVVREEIGVLPMPWRGDYPVTGSGALVAGYRGGWFHPATGYSFPVAVRVAEHVARTAPEDITGPELAALAADQRRHMEFCYQLNKMLFCWFPPERRTHVFERFYRLSPGTIRRFYALSMTRFDRVRMLVGRPPRGLSIRRAVLSGSRS